MASRTTITATGRSSSNSVVDVLDRVIGLPPTNGGGGGANGESEKFIASDEFRGPRAGYAFRTSEEFGTGYHLDDDENDEDENGNNGTAALSSSHGERKRARFDSSRDTTRVIPPRAAAAANKKTKVPLSGEELLAEAEEALASSSSQGGGRHARILDPTPRGVRIASQGLERAMSRNALARAQHPDDPSKFMTSELALNDEILNFKAAAADVTSYVALEECGVVASLLTLMEHENSDVAMAAIGVMAELLDPDLLTSAADDGGDVGGVARRGMGILADAFVDGGGLDLLSSNLGRFDEAVEEDAAGVEDALTLAESLLDLDRAGVLRADAMADGRGGTKDNAPPSSVASCLCERTSFVSWLFRRIGREDSDDVDNDSSQPDKPTTSAVSVSPAVVRLHASEVLSAVLQHEDYSSRRCGRRLAKLPEYTSAFDDDDNNRDGTNDTKMAAKDDDGDKNGSKKKEDENNTIDGIEILLLAVAAYRKSDPSVEAECEFLENAFDALAASLLREDNVDDFVEAEGIELMLRCVRQRVHAGGPALRVLDFALSGSSQSSSPPLPPHSSPGATLCDGAVDDNAYGRACETFVSAGGLRILFPLFMGRRSAVPCPARCSEGGSDLAMRKGDKSSKRARRAARARRRWLAEAERNAIGIVYALTRHVGVDSKHDAHARLLAKFVEEDCEKCDRAIELCLKYDERARIAEYEYYRSEEAEEAESSSGRPLGTEHAELAALDAKLRGGGGVFHMCCAVLSFACVGSRRCRCHVLDQLKLQGSGMSVIKEGLIEFATLLGDGTQKSQIEHYITEL